LLSTKSKRLENEDINKREREREKGEEEKKNIHRQFGGKEGGQASIASRAYRPHAATLSLSFFFFPSFFFFLLFAFPTSFKECFIHVSYT